MTVLVSDASVLIDLERGGFLEAIFSLNYEFAVPDVLYRGEMAGEWGRRLVELGLRVEEVSADGVAKALHYRSTRSVLSIPDSFALALAQERRWTLLTGTETSGSLRRRNQSIATVSCGCWTEWRRRACQTSGVSSMDCGRSLGTRAAGCHGGKSRPAWSGMR